jgi:hypothetical protein
LVTLFLEPDRRGTSNPAILKHPLIARSSPVLKGIGIVHNCITFNRNWHSNDLHTIKLNPIVHGDILHDILS